MKLVYVLKYLVMSLCRKNENDLLVTKYFVIIIREYLFFACQPSEQEMTMLEYIGIVKVRQPLRLIKLVLFLYFLNLKFKKVT